MPQLSYRVGIDVGLRSVGLAAIRIDDDGAPTEILSLETIVHDSGIDPNSNKTAGTRKAVSGVARRMRRLIRRRRQRLDKLDRVLEGLGLPIIDLESNPDPYYPWRVRNALVEARIENPAEQRAMLSVAMRHLARHRGWRSPYASIESLRVAEGPSQEFGTFIEALEQKVGVPVDRNLTVSQIVVRALRTQLTQRLRGVGGLLEHKVHQSDNVREIKSIWETQGLPDEWFTQVLHAVFAARSPKGSAAGRVGRDPLDRSARRAEKASLAFQRFRIVCIVANLRIREPGQQDERPLSSDERREVVEFLWEASSRTVSWDDVASRIGIRRRQLVGTAEATADGDRAGARPPVNVTAERIRDSKIKDLVAQWEIETDGGREALIAALSNGASVDDVDSEDFGRATEFIGSLPEELLGKLDDLKLPEGRAAYGARTLRRLTRRMESTEEDLHAARMAVFGVPDDWHPPAEPIGEPVGNPAVDRVLKIVNRWLHAVQAEWGDPLSVNVEHTRDGLISELTARKIDRENNRRAAINQSLRADLAEYLARNRAENTAGDDSFTDGDGGPMSGVSARDVARYRAFTRQDGRCLYCGAELRFGAMEMDHIVPRAGQGATNAQVNLAAVCRPCNHSKGKLPFAVWAQSGRAPVGVSLDGAIQRANEMFGMGSKRPDEREFIRSVVARLRRSEADEEIDSRSMESVGWMANELRHRLEGHFRRGGAQTVVGVFRGQITWDARKASGIEGRLLLIGGKPGKNRLDRRHHAIDAAVIALLRPGVAQALVVRDNLRRSQMIVGRDTDEIEWKLFRGANESLFNQWVDHMVILADLVQNALDQDRVPVFEFLRLKLGSSKGHEDIVRSFRGERKGGSWVAYPTIRLQDEIPADTIDRSATPAQWVALTRSPDFVPGIGLPANPERRIRIRNQRVEPSDQLDFFPTGSGCLAVRDGYVELGAAFHHARIYRCVKRLKSGKETVFFAMMRVYQADLVGHRSDDLFKVDIPPQAISRRAAEGRLREAIDAGTAEYVGWIVTGDELLLDMSSQTSGAVAELLAAYPGTNRWSVDGLFASTRLRLRPKLLSGEGLPESAHTDVKAIIAGRGWLPSVSVVFGECRAVVVRRDVLGRPRLVSSRGLPVCWPTAPLNAREV